MTELVLIKAEIAPGRGIGRMQVQRLAILGHGLFQPALCAQAQAKVVEEVRHVIPFRQGGAYPSFPFARPPFLHVEHA